MKSLQDKLTELVVDAKSRAGAVGPVVVLREQDVVLLARRYTRSALAVLVRMMKDPKVNANVRARCAEKVLEIGSKSLDVQATMSPEQIEEAALKIAARLHSRGKKPEWLPVAVAHLERGSVPEALSVALAEDAGVAPPPICVQMSPASDAAQFSKEIAAVDTAAVAAEIRSSSEAEETTESAAAQTAAQKNIE